MNIILFVTMDSRCGSQILRLQFWMGWTDSWLGIISEIRIWEWDYERHIFALQIHWWCCIPYEALVLLTIQRWKKNYLEEFLLEFDSIKHSYDCRKKFKSLNRNWCILLEIIDILLWNAYDIYVCIFYAF